MLNFKWHMQLELECPIRTCVKLAATLCVMWFARRNVIHGSNIFQSPLSTHLFVERFLAELDEIKSLPNNSWQQSTAAARAMGQPLRSARNLPLIGTWKIMWMAPSSAMVQWAVVCHDQDGKYPGSPTGYSSPSETSNIGGYCMSGSTCPRSRFITYKICYCTRLQISGT